MRQAKTLKDAEIKRVLAYCATRQHALASARFHASSARRRAATPGSTDTLLGQSLATPTEPAAERRLLAAAGWTHTPADVPGGLLKVLGLKADQNVHLARRAGSRPCPLGHLPQELTRARADPDTNNYKDRYTRTWSSG